MNHLTLEQRYTIEVMHKKGFKQADIAATIGKDKSVVCRELKRNCDPHSGVYRSDLAHQKYEKRLTEKPKFIRFTPSVRRATEKLLREDCSPEQVVAILKKKGKPTVSIERIYQHIWEDQKQGGDLYKHLRTKGKRYRRRKNTQDI